MNKLTSFAKQCIAKLNGDDAAATAEKIWRQADSALRVQIGQLEGDAIAKEDAVTEAKDALADAMINGGVIISDRTLYVQNLINANAGVKKAEKAYADHLANLAFLQETYDNLGKEVTE